MKIEGQVIIRGLPEPIDGGIHARQRVQGLNQGRKFYICGTLEEITELNAQPGERYWGEGELNFRRFEMYIWVNFTSIRKLD